MEPANRLCADVLTGFVPHFYKGKLSGTVTINGRDVFDALYRTRRSVTGLVFATFQPNLGCAFYRTEEIAFGLENFALPRGNHRPDRRSCGIQPHGFSRASPTALSGGQQQQLWPRLCHATASAGFGRSPLHVDPVNARGVFPHWIL